MIVKAIITTMDNLPLLEQQVRILASDSLVSEIVVVANGCIDGTNSWLAAQPNLTSVIRENSGAGPGRNAGLDVAGEFDYVLLLDGGIRPLRGGVHRMLDYLQRHPDVDVIGVEVPAFETDEAKAWRRWPDPLTDEQTYQHSLLSLTAYCLARPRAWEGLRFSEEGPFGRPGWGVDDDELACRWKDAGIIVHAIVSVHPYRRSSGSFNRLFRETGVWPNQYGSVYEERLVWMQQNMPQHGRGCQWGEPWLTIVVKAGEFEPMMRLVKLAHELLRERRFPAPWKAYWNPYSIVIWTNDPQSIAAAEPHRLRQHHGTKKVVNGQIVGRTTDNDPTWTGDFRVWKGEDWKEAIRRGSHYYGLVTDEEELREVVGRYNEAAICRESAPLVIGEKLGNG